MQPFYETSERVSRGFGWQVASGEWHFDLARPCQKAEVEIWKLALTQGTLFGWLAFGWPS